MAKKSNIFYGQDISRFNYASEISRGSYSPSRFIIHKFGRNPAVGNSMEYIWTVGGLYTWPTAAATLEAISTDADDTSGGDGARTIRVEGLNAAWDMITEDITMNGTSATDATTQSFMRVKGHMF